MIPFPVEWWGMRVIGSDFRDTDQSCQQWRISRGRKNDFGLFIIITVIITFYLLYFSSIIIRGDRRCRQGGDVVDFPTAVTPTVSESASYALLFLLPGLPGTAGHRDRNYSRIQCCHLSTYGTCSGTRYKQTSIVLQVPSSNSSYCWLVGKWWCAVCANKVIVPTNEGVKGKPCHTYSKY